MNHEAVGAAAQAGMARMEEMLEAVSLRRGPHYAYALRHAATAVFEIAQFQALVPKEFPWNMMGEVIAKDLSMQTLEMSAAYASRISPDHPSFQQAALDFTNEMEPLLGAFKHLQHSLTSAIRKG
jgi:hypothetical protein